MSDVAIRVEKLGKLYRIGREERYRTLRDTLVEGAQGAVRAVRGLFSRDGRRTESPPTIWALKDVSFEVKRGEVLGIIGRNGAGKTTLLKILSRVTEPTEGYAEIRGRVGSLLEVGTGFHPELTGRENIYLYGAILGMKKAEIQRKFDEIVAFAEVEKFIDTPVKHYSSGMYLRLAFAVAAHLEPEILLVDEVLAVGDAQFQKKCLGKMGDVAGEGRTVLFVSHNLPAVEALTHRSLWIDSGRIAAAGLSRLVVATYLNSCGANLADTDVTNRQRNSPRYGVHARVLRIIPRAQRGEAFLFGEDLRFDIDVRCDAPTAGLRFGFTIEAQGNGPIMTGFTPENIWFTKTGEHRCRLMIRRPGLAPGSYELHVSVGRGSWDTPREELDVVRPGVTFSVSPAALSGNAPFNWLRSYGFLVGDPQRIELVNLGPIQ